MFQHLVVGAQLDTVAARLASVTVEGLAAVNIGHQLIFKRDAVKHRLGAQVAPFAFDPQLTIERLRRLQARVESAARRVGQFIDRWRFE
ncbi:hypothetical protein D9M71_501000 [compost metagenome]